MSLTRPASTCCRRPPPPQVWNRSGTSPCWSRVVSLVLNASFSLTWMSIVTFGWAAVYSSASVLPQAEARVVVLDVVPGDRDRLAGGLGRRGAGGARGRRRRRGRGAVDGAGVAAPPLEQAPSTNIAVAARAAIRPRDIVISRRSSTSLISDGCATHGVDGCVVASCASVRAFRLGVRDGPRRERQPADAANPVSRLARANRAKLSDAACYTAAHEHDRRTPAGAATGPRSP